MSADRTLSEWAEHIRWQPPAEGYVRLGYAVEGYAEDRELVDVASAGSLSVALDIAVELREKGAHHVHVRPLDLRIPPRA